MDTLAIIIIAGLVTIVILVLIMRNTILSNRIEDAHIENDRLIRENKDLEKECNELFHELNDKNANTPSHSNVPKNNNV